MEANKFLEFIRITEKLNELDIVPLLMGSVGFEVVTGRSWHVRDLDIHIPGDKRGFEVAPELSIYQWDNIVSLMEGLGYELTDLHEHAFSQDGSTVEFAAIDTLPDFAGIPLDELEMKVDGHIKYYLLNKEQYLRVYMASSKDSYRADKNNRKDFEKIAYLKQL
ncbi:hypothetical protein [Alkalihalobacillus pseudalcaliphilus]|uniref:hypothetical protein n=1 Tax=Alkalihalobacillus pseudalcaliphilus TaxID=79884 RepID=UPI00064D9018|nr:hypothetical protein [Alkalihalobacillus pseudalcaliphilus]KMK74346.1 phosphoribosylanthranilate isomerase [Alkalihalobacillus pseudalcaliphilus]